MTEVKEKRHPDYAPKQTLYINNLNEKVKIEDLRQTLFFIFSKFGKLLSLTAKHNIRMKGQAFVVYAAKEDAVKAKESLDKAVLFKQEMHITFAKDDADIVHRLDGSYKYVKRPGYVCKPLKSGVKDSKKILQKEKEEQENLLPNKVLFVEDLPQTTTEELLKIFQTQSGFREVRYVAPKACAFVEFEDEFQAGMALNYLNGYRLTPEKSMKIGYAKR